MLLYVSGGVFMYKIALLRSFITWWLLVGAVPLRRRCLYRYFVLLSRWLAPGESSRVRLQRILTELYSVGGIPIANVSTYSACMECSLNVPTFRAGIG